MNTQPIYLALYKGRRDGYGWRVWCARATDWLTRILTRGQYSHAEIVVRAHPQASVYTCYSASIRDKGVRCKVMPLPAGIAFGLPQNRRRWFCSEWCATTLGLPAGWRWSPNDLATIVPALYKEEA